MWSSAFNIKTVAVATLLCVGMLFPTLSSAQTDYTVLAPVTGFVGTEVQVGGEDGTNLSSYLNSLFRLGVGLATGLAVIMIVVGGVQYASSDAWSRKQDGMQKLQAAVFGLLIAIGSVALLNTVDPDILSTELKLERVELEEIKTLAPRPETGIGSDRPREHVSPEPSKPIEPGTPGTKFTDPQVQKCLADAISGSSLSSFTPSDAGRYFPNGQATPENWQALFAKIAQKESNFNPNLTYTESFSDSTGSRVISTGLLQISQESARGYGFPGMSTEQLKDSCTNLQVGVKIMEKWVAQDGCISCKSSSGAWRGGARYWAVLRK